jgi:hypothetical protein
LKKLGVWDSLPLLPILQGLHLGLVVVLNVLLCSCNPLFSCTRRGIIHRGLSWIFSMASWHCWSLGFAPRLELLEPTSRGIHLHSQWHHLGTNQASYVLSRQKSHRRMLKWSTNCSNWIRYPNQQFFVETNVLDDTSACNK